MNSLLIRNTSKRHYDLSRLSNDIASFDKNLPTEISFCADVEMGWMCGDVVCMTVTVSPDGEVLATDTPKQFKPYTTPPVIIDGVLYANQEEAKTLEAARASAWALAQEEFMSDGWDLYKILRIDDDFRIVALDEHGNTHSLKPDKFKPHSGWNWRGRD